MSEAFGECRKVVLTLAMADFDYPNGLRFTREALREAADSDPCLSFNERSGFLECETDVTGFRELVVGNEWEIEFTFPICPALFEAGIVQEGLDLSIVLQTIDEVPEEMKRTIESAERNMGLR